ncbi:MAG: hypothetical protein OEN56_12760, partial [Gemmatimonadota bacterium]|nr:hypothetical protein [Gemmatimonadota bacterium]
RRIDLHHPVRRMDVRTRKDGFRVLHAWNHTSHRFTEDIVPVLLIDFFQRANPTEPNERFVVELLLDYYLFHLLALCAMRVWDADDPDGALSRTTDLVTALQGEHGSGHQFVADGETLLIYALSQFHPEEQAYDHLIERVATLDEGHRLAFAQVSAAVLSAHLRWGFWLMYGRDVVRMRDDNVGDYPWLLIAVLWLMRAWVAATEAGEESVGGTGAEREEILEALLQGLAADPWAFAGPAPSSFEGYRVEYDELRALLESHGEALLESLEVAHKPTKTEYAPLALHFNFPHNTLVAIVTLALLEGKPQSLPLNALFRRQMDQAGQEAKGAAPDGETQEGLARTLMAFSAGSPDRLGHRGAMLVAYDPLSAMRSFSMTTKALRKSLTSS